MIEENNSWCIYKHTLKGTNKVYIGQTKNIKHSASHNKAISESLKGYKQTEKHKYNNRMVQHRKPVECLETHMKYESLSEPERCTGILGETISRQIRGKQKSTQGLHWRFIDEL